MPSKSHLTVIVLLSVALWATILSINGTPLSLDLLKPFSFVIALLGVALYLFDKSLWRAPLLFDWFVRRPYISGTWKVQLILIPPDTNPGPERLSVPAFASITQTYSSLTLRLMTEESSSDLVSERLARMPDGAYQLAAVYVNTPRISLQSKSRPHYGAMLLRASGNRPKIMEGHYWTDRGTFGELKFLRRVGQHAASYEEAKGMVASA